MLAEVSDGSDAGQGVFLGVSRMFGKGDRLLSKFSNNCLVVSFILHARGSNRRTSRLSTGGQLVLYSGQIAIFRMWRFSETETRETIRLLGIERRFPEAFGFLGPHKNVRYALHSHTKDQLIWPVSGIITVEADKRLERTKAKLLLCPACNCRVHLG
jgi:hypothetical protein